MWQCHFKALLPHLSLVCPTAVTNLVLQVVTLLQMSQELKRYHQLRKQIHFKKSHLFNLSLIRNAVQQHKEKKQKSNCTADPLCKEKLEASGICTQSHTSCRASAKNGFCLHSEALFVSSLTSAEQEHTFHVCVC